MSLPNPNLPVTEERLQEFYQQIKPYLGLREMPSGDMGEIVNPKPVTANGGHRYSTEEHIVGTWIDGRTLYEKTIPFTVPTVVTEGVSASANIPNSALSDVEDVIYVEGWYKSDNGLYNFINNATGSSASTTPFRTTACFIFYNKPNSYFTISNSIQTHGGRTGYFTAIYTKTT